MLEALTKHMEPKDIITFLDALIQAYKKEPSKRNQFAIESACMMLILKAAETELGPEFEEYKAKAEAVHNMLNFGKQ